MGQKFSKSSSQAVIKSRLTPKELAVVLEVLRKYSISENSYPQLYEVVIKNLFSESVDKLIPTFEIMKEAGISLAEHCTLYEEIFKVGLLDLKKLAAGFLALQEAGISFQDHPQLYDVVIKHPLLADKLAAGFVALQEAGISFQDHPQLYAAVIQLLIGCVLERSP